MKIQSFIVLLIAVVFFMEILSVPTNATTLGSDFINDSANCIALSNNIVGINDNNSLNSTNTAELKFVTINATGWGTVKVREDMVVKKGDTYTIVPNSDYRTNGVITPVLITPPSFDYVTINSGSYQLKVPKDKFAEKGKDKITSDFAKALQRLTDSKNYSEMRKY